MGDGGEKKMPAGAGGERERAKRWSLRRVKWPRARLIDGIKYSVRFPDAGVYPTLPPIARFTHRQHSHEQRQLPSQQKYVALSWAEFTARPAISN